jgi:hypothetical protein
VNIVTDESHTLSVGFPVFLDNRNVDVSSVLITDAFVTLLVEGLDYELQVVGEEVRVVRLRDPVFPIVGEEILVDYLFMPGGDLLYDSTTIHAGASVELFRRFRISYRFNDVSQDLREGDPETNRLQEVTDHRVDIRYFEGNRSGFGYEVSAFYQDHDSTFSPFVSYGVDGNIVLRVWQRNTVDLSASYSISEFPDTDEETDVLTTTGTLVSAVGPTSNLILEALYRDVGGSIDERTSFKFSVRFEAVFRLVRLSVEASHEVENERDQDRETSLVFMKVTRSF